MVTRTTAPQRGHQVHPTLVTVHHLGHQVVLLPVQILDQVLHHGHQVELVIPIPEVVPRPGPQVELEVPIPEVVLHPGHQVVLVQPILVLEHRLGHQVVLLVVHLFHFLMLMDQTQVVTVDMAVMM